MSSSNPTATATVTIDEIGRWPIEGLPGLEARLLRLSVPPGLHAPLHHHDGWQLVHVTAGTVVSQMDGDVAHAYDAGDAWFEQRAQRHLTFANETDQTATVVVFFITEPGQPVLSFDEAV